MSEKTPLPADAILKPILRGEVAPNGFKQQTINYPSSLTVVAEENLKAGTVQLFGGYTEKNTDVTIISNDNTYHLTSDNTGFWSQELKDPHQRVDIHAGPEGARSHIIWTMTSEIPKKIEQKPQSQKSEVKITHQIQTPNALPYPNNIDIFSKYAARFEAKANQARNEHERKMSVENATFYINLVLKMSPNHTGARTIADRLGIPLPPTQLPKNQQA